MLNQDSHLSDPELLLAADGELSARRLGEAKAHLEVCWICRSRMAQLERTLANFALSYHSLLDPQVPPEGDSGARFGVRLLQRVPLPRSAFSLQSLLRWKWAALAPLVLCAAFMAGIFPWRQPHRLSGMRQTVSRLEPEIVPDPSLTPGEATLASKSEVCRANRQAERRQLPEALKHAVFAEYGMKDEPQDAYEVDFLITPELGGSASIRNLWPQPYSRAWNAHVKDALEDRLHALVCSGDLDLSTAQREIAANWVDAYKKYVQTDNPM